MSYKITIINNDDNSVIVNEENAVAIIGAITNGENTACLAHTVCNGSDILNTLIGVERAKKTLFDEHPLLKLFYECVERSKDIEPGTFKN